MAGTRFTSPAEYMTVCIDFYGAWAELVLHACAAQLRHPDSVLALATMPIEGHICAGYQDSSIRVWDASTFQCLKVLIGHTRAVVTLVSQTTGGSDPQRLLLSSSRDTSVRIWAVAAAYACVAVVPLASGNVMQLTAMPVLLSRADAADVHVSSTRIAVFAGCQNTKVISTQLAVPLPAPATSPLASSKLGAASLASTTPPITPTIPTVKWHVHSAHYGYVYSVALRQLGEPVPIVDAVSASGLRPPAIETPATSMYQVLTGSGDGTIGVWAVQQDSWQLTYLGRMEGHSGSVYALQIVGSEVYSGAQDGTIRVWDMDTRHCKSVMSGHKQEVLCLAVSTVASAAASGLSITPIQFLCSGSADHTVRLWSTRTYSCLHVLRGHTDIVVSLAVSRHSLFSGSTDKTIRVWDLSRLDVTTPSDSGSSFDGGREDDMLRLESPLVLTEAHLIALLRKFVAIPTVSSQPHHHQQCWRGAKFVQELLRCIGAENKLAQVAQGRNPIVIGRLGWDPALPTITIHGHYDVMPADSPDWTSQPFELTGEDGYLYGRGSSDNKGPVLAAIFGAALSRQPATVFGGSLGDGEACRANFAFVFEGEGENGSDGFQETVLENKDWFAGTTLIMNNNSKWLGDTTPCLTYGLRGRLCFEVEVLGSGHDLHSGVDGGVGNEPLMDLMAVVSGLLEPSTGRVLVPGFYANLRAISERTAKLYEDLDFDASEYVALAEIASVYQPWTPPAAVAAPVMPGTFSVSDDIAIVGTAPSIPKAVCSPVPVLKRPRTDPPPIDSTDASNSASTFTFDSPYESPLVEPSAAAASSEAIRLLMLRWRMPSLSVHSVSTSSSISSVIPARASAVISLRTVPDQDSAVLEQIIHDHLVSAMAARGTRNTLRMRVKARGKWWLQDPFSDSYQAAARAIEKHWGVKPNFVCEGGTLRVTPFLEEVLHAPAIHLPLAQSTDNAHVANERLRINNLIVGVKVLRSLLCELGSTAAHGEMKVEAALS